MYHASCSGLGVAGSWYADLVAKNPKVDALVPWETPASYGALFTEGWKLQDTRRYVTQYPTFELMVRAVDGIGKYITQALSWAEQLPQARYREAGLIFIDVVLREAQRRNRALLDMVLYNSQQYGLIKTSHIPWNFRVTLFLLSVPGGVSSWTNPVKWATAWAEAMLTKAFDHVAPMGWTVKTIIKTYNLTKKYKEAFEYSVKSGKLHPDLANLPELAESGMLAQLKAAAQSVDNSAGALDTLQALGVLPSQPDTFDPGVPPVMPDPQAEATQPPVAWYWWAGALVAGAVGTGLGILFLKPKRLKP